MMSDLGLPFLFLAPKLETLSPLEVSEESVDCRLPGWSCWHAFDDLDRLDDDLARHDMKLVLISGLRCAVVTLLGNFKGFVMLKFGGEADES